MKRTSGWNQEVTDAQGRRRFHGAFTGGFSAGHFNSVGTEEGWQPATFASSRASRGSASGSAPPPLTAQRPEDFMDEEDDPLLGKRLETSEAYDTLQQAARQRVRDAVGASSSCSSTAPTTRAFFHVPDELLLPPSDSIGKKLLSQMGWKDGHGIGPRLRRRKLLSIGSPGGHSDEKTSKASGTREGAEEEQEDDVYVPPRNAIDIAAFPTPKLDKYGAGFDPYVDAPEFMRHKKRIQEEKQNAPARQVVTFAQALGGGGGSRETRTNGRVAMGFGLSALEENDDLEVYDAICMDDFDRAIEPSASSSSVPKIDSMTSDARMKIKKAVASSLLCSDGRPALPKFCLSTKQEKPPKEVIQRLEVPSDFRAYHVFDDREMQAASTTGLYSKFNFSTEKTGRSSMVTATQRAQILLGDDASHSKAPANPPTVVPSKKTVFDLLDPAQRAKLLGAAALATRDRKPLVQATATSAQFRANITASIAKRFVSASVVEGGSTLPAAVDDLPAATPQEKEQKSHRTQQAWAPHAVLCKRFQVKCQGQTISGGSGGRAASDESTVTPDLFSTELAPHLIDYAAQRRAPQQEAAQPQPLSRRTGVATKDEDELPPLPVTAKPPTDLLRSIFEPSDESDMDEEDQEDDEEEEKSDSDDDDKEQKEVEQQQLKTVKTTQPSQDQRLSATRGGGGQSESLSSADSGSSSGSDDETASHTKKRKSRTGSSGGDAMSSDMSELQKLSSSSKKHKTNKSKKSKREKKEKKDKKSKKEKKKSSSRHSSDRRSSKESRSRHRSSDESQKSRKRSRSRSRSRRE